MRIPFFTKPKISELSHYEKMQLDYIAKLPTQERQSSTIKRLWDKLRLVGILLILLCSLLLFLGIGTALGLGLAVWAVTGVWVLW